MGKKRQNKTSFVVHATRTTHYSLSLSSGFAFFSVTVSFASCEKDNKNVQHLADLPAAQTQRLHKCGAGPLFMFCSSGKANEKGK